VSYYLVGKRLKNYVLLFFSIAFYSWGAPVFIFVLLVTTFIDYHLVKWIDQSANSKKRKILLTLSIAINLGLLIYFKYSNFFIENINVFLGMVGLKNIVWTKLILPIGISFYTFETITYVVDVYRRVHKPLSKFQNYLLYILFFPKLIAGPIVRYHDMADQLEDRSKNDTIDNRLIGLYQFIIGLAKKVIIANHLGEHADQIFGLNYDNLGASTAWIGALCYTFQLYFDFSGYSDMAIGLAKMVGFKIPENFNNPYIASSITDFWRRWHISLGNWMRNYLYIPLGGNKVSSKRLYFNLGIVFIASGFWHGASWNFIIWGTYHGMFLILERLFLLKVYQKIGRLLSTILTFFFVCIGWVFFRIDHLESLMIYLKQLINFSQYTYYPMDSEFLSYAVLAIVSSFFAYFSWGQRVQTSFYHSDYTIQKHLLIGGVSFGLLVLSIAFITAYNFNPFIYFRF
jgi:alginate O-acetyltransferase complex protein AlgI